MECQKEIEELEEGYIYSDNDDYCDRDNDNKTFDTLYTNREQTKDGRLFPGLLLYCEGHEKPKLRGVSHLICTFFLFYCLYDLYTEANNNLIGQISAVLYVSSNIYCYGISAIYHIGKWSIKTEILLQKLDHCGIAILGCGTMLPVSFLLLPLSQGLLLSISAISICIYTCYHIFNCRPSVLRLALNGCTLIPFLPQLYYCMNDIEYTCTILVFAFQITGLAVFIVQKPKLCPKIFGYHELFHIFVICAGGCVYICNWSVIRRICNTSSSGSSNSVWYDICQCIEFIKEVLSFDLFTIAPVG